jgi:3-methyladenine DNA glycosylase AlkD
MAKSSNLWEKRISIVSTLYFIRKDKTDIVYKIVNLLMKDRHDLIHKACGWMLREAGKRGYSDMYRMEKYIRSNISNIPRTMLRYAIERMPESKRLSMIRLGNE